MDSRHVCVCVCVCVCARARVRAFVRSFVHGMAMSVRREYARAYVGINACLCMCVHVRAGVFQCPRCIHKSVCACE